MIVTDERAPERVVPSSPQPEAPAPRGTGRWRLRNWRLRTKLVAVLVVPLLLAGGLAGLRIATSTGDAAALDAVERQVGRAEQVAALVQELQRERTLAASFVAGDRTGDRGPLDDQIGVVDARVADITGADAADFGPAATDVLRAARTRLAGLGPLRATTSGTAYPAESVIIAYTSIIDSVRTLDRTVLGAVSATLQRQAADDIVVGDAKEQVQRQHAVLLVVLRTGAATATQQAAARAGSAQLDATLAQFAAAALPASRELYSRTVSGAEVDARERIEQSALVAFATGAPPPSDVAAWDAAAGRTADRMREVESTLLGELRAAAGQLAGEARAAAIRDALVVAGLALIALLLLVLVGRSLVRPLRVLRASAFDVAERRLPEAITWIRNAKGDPGASFAIEPIGVDTREEVGEVARAFDAVHREAVRLAAEQALLRSNVNDIFVNLSRRSQGLVRRQLKLIDELESGEQDPEHLGNLFQLDHLATRMRRNNENLLVLADAGEQRQRRRRPVAVIDVLRAAVSEIEEYSRVVVRPAPDRTIAGPVVDNLVHLVAELLDNATSYSAPETRVVLSSALHDGRLVIEITDSGVGIPLDELTTVNAQLAAPPIVDVAVSRRMGLFVVGRLAERHALGVRLRPAVGAPGLVASVEVPTEHLLDASGAPVDGAARRASGDASARRPSLDGAARSGTGDGAERRPSADGAAVRPSGDGLGMPLQTARVDAPENRVLRAPVEPPVPRAAAEPYPTQAPPAGAGGLPARRPGATLTPVAAPDDPDDAVDSGPLPVADGRAERRADADAAGTGVVPVDGSAVDATVALAPVAAAPVAAAPVTAGPAVTGLAGTGPAEDRPTEDGPAGNGAAGNGAAGNGPAANGAAGNGPAANGAAAPAESEALPGPTPPVDVPASETVREHPAAPQQRPGPVVASPRTDAEPVAAQTGPTGVDESVFAPSGAAPAPPELPSFARRTRAWRPGEDPLTSPTVGLAGDDDQPIFEEMRSAWFRQRRRFGPVEFVPPPADFPLRRPAADSAPRTPGSAPRGAPPPAARPTPAAGSRPGVPVGSPAVDRGPADPTTDLPLVDPFRATDSPTSDDWGWAADEGRRVVDALGSGPEPEVTAAGLPRRRPQAQLLPGSAGRGRHAEAPGRPRRSADAVRGQLSGYQRGLRAGRAARDAGPASAGADGSAGP